MDTISKTLKAKKSELEGKISFVDSEISSLDTATIQAKENKIALQAELTKIDNFLTKESELDALFSN